MADFKLPTTKVYREQVDTLPDNCILFVRTVVTKGRLDVITNINDAAFELLGDDVEKWRDLVMLGVGEAIDNASKKRKDDKARV